MKQKEIITELEQSKELIAACLENGESVELAISRNGKLKAFRKRTYHLQLPDGKRKGGANDK